MMGAQSFEAELRRLVAEGSQRYGVPGLAVGVINGDEEHTVYQGVTSVENPLDVDRATLFQAGSTSKTYTATAIMILAHQGRLDIQAPVRRYLPDLRLGDESVAARVTVLQLLNHTGGWLGDIIEDTGEGADALATYVRHLAGAVQRAPLGMTASYNNAAFAIAGRVIELVAEEEFEAAVRHLLLDPLGLGETFYFPGEVLTRRFVVGHIVTAKGTQVARPWHVPRSVHPMGGIITTLGDVLSYARLHLGHPVSRGGRPVLDLPSIRLMQEPTVGGGGLADSVGIAWMLNDIGGVRVASHGGTTNGHVAALHVVPDRQFAIVVLCNANTGAALIREVTSWALDRCLGLRRPPAAPLDLDVVELRAFAGTYSSLTSTLTISVDDDHLIGQRRLTASGRAQLAAVLGDEPTEPGPMKLVVLEGDRLLVAGGEAAGTKLVASRDGNGRVVGISIGGRLAHRVD